MFQRILKAYATKLFGKLPKGGTGIVAAATGTDGQIKVFSFFILFTIIYNQYSFLHIEFTVLILLFPYFKTFQTSDRDERIICYIVNTAEYCHKTVSLVIKSYIPLFPIPHPT